MGKTSCSLAGKRKKAELDEGEEEEEGEFELRIVQKTVKKGAEDGGVEEQVRKKVKKPKAKQDVEMAEVSERAEDGDAEAEKVRKKVEKSKTKQDVEMTVYEGAEDALADDDVEITEVRLEREQVKQEDSEMIDLTNVESDIGTPSRVDKGKGRATPAITLEPPTPTPPVRPISLTMDAQEKTSADLEPYRGPSPQNGKNQCFCYSPH